MKEILSYVEYRQRVLLRENDSDNPGDYSVVGSPDKKSTWHLPVKRGGTPDHRLMSAAKAALLSNFRGHAYSGPDKGSALAALKALYKSEGMKWDDSEGEE
jgi:hypothetical protein